MKLNIDWESKTITLLDEWNLEALHSKLKELCGNEEGNWESWTIKSEVKTLTKEQLTYPVLPLSQPYKPFGNQPIVTFDNTDTYSHT